jgi:hypothetical protein
MSVTDWFSGRSWLSASSKHAENVKASMSTKTPVGATKFVISGAAPLSITPVYNASSCANMSVPTKIGIHLSLTALLNLGVNIFNSKVEGGSVADGCKQSAQEIGEVVYITKEGAIAITELLVGGALFCTADPLVWIYNSTIGRVSYHDKQAADINIAGNTIDLSE